MFQPKLIFKQVFISKGFDLMILHVKRACNYLFKKNTSVMLLKLRALAHSNFKQGGCHIVALPFTLKRILKQKKNYENSNISPCKNIIFKKSSKRNQNPSIYYNSITNLKFQHKSKYHLLKFLI
jgi:hypothetical protein